LIRQGIACARGLDHREREVAPVSQKEVHALRRLAHKAAADRDDAAICDGSLLSDGVRIGVPASGLEGGHDVPAAGIGFRLGQTRHRGT
jgi:hypothetical protein